MIFYYGKQDLHNLQPAQEPCFLLTNGLGGYCSVTAAMSAPRADQGLLIAAVRAPNLRVNLVHRLCQTLTVGSQTVFLSTQAFADGTPAEDGWKRISAFTLGELPRWVSEYRGIRVTQECCMAREENTTALRFTVENRSGNTCTLNLEPFFKFAPKEDAVNVLPSFTYEKGRISCGAYTLHIKTDAELSPAPAKTQLLDYTEDAKDGRPGKGLSFSCCRVLLSAADGETRRFSLVFSTEPAPRDTETIFSEHAAHLQQLDSTCPLRHPTARVLARAADAFIARRDSTGGKTILAGYPLFSDWGRDTMIALPGCTMATGRFEDAKSILRTFLAYERNGLVPNLFPEGGAEPMYNTVDAALLLIDSVWQYYIRTGDLAFANEAFPVMQRIIAAYRRGTLHSIAMDTDGLILAGSGKDQVTWMDVCVNGILPTPRHGKPVEISAYWYNALKIMEALSAKLGRDGGDYGTLAETVKTSFLEKFYMTDRGYLRDVISGTQADTQLRCNQIWAVSMSFTMLTPDIAQSVVDAVSRHLYTPCGLRTLSPDDPQYHGTYGGDQMARDMAYHQGTAWVFPLGAYYLAKLKTMGSTKAAAREILTQLDALFPMLRQGCSGQLPEIYDGENPTEGKGCFAQAWSVGEMLRVFEAIEAIEQK